MISEFDIISRFFNFSDQSALKLGIGDDAAVVDLSSAVSFSSGSSSSDLVVATDTLLADVHFPSSMPAAHVASRSLLVNVSDFSAMGVRPRWYTLALALPDADNEWLAEFSASLKYWSECAGLSLVGGDTTRGPLAITLTLFGVADNGYLTRSGAKAGQSVWVTNTLGRGGASLHCVQGKATEAIQTIEATDPTSQSDLLQHFYAPASLLDFAEDLNNIASSAIDISDGLLADAGHIAKRSGVDLVIDWEKLPVSDTLYQLADQSQVREWVLSHGDEYQLLFTANANNQPDIKALESKHGVLCSCIGSVLASGNKAPAVSILNDPITQSVSGEAATQGYDHFTSDS